MDENIVLYTIGCVKCKTLEDKLRASGVRFDTVSDIDSLTREGLSDAVFPVLKINGEMKDFNSAMLWLRDR